jgi:hypothetical protein
MAESAAFIECGNKEPLFDKILSKTKNYNKLEKLQQCMDSKEWKLSRIDT